ncbi:hypothetical protein GQ53DRAFT_123942 [Thozetella sp. PMI_491]|nr:hypothetical protein GQ53DRAFT_123942 [Thozetella sp. PMI_491]
MAHSLARTARDTLVRDTSQKTAYFENVAARMPVRSISSMQINAKVGWAWSDIGAEGHRGNPHRVGLTRCNARYFVHDAHGSGKIKMGIRSGRSSRSGVRLADPVCAAGRRQKATHDSCQAPTWAQLPRISPLTISGPLICGLRADISSRIGRDRVTGTTHHTTQQQAPKAGSCPHARRRSGRAAVRYKT